ncbi:MAG: twin-arginine translocase TatA/TatE family subunit [Anaerolinea sp.]|nr:twin-arginine translocase TatA/TatE family subunit [Anaerolinea sp.]MCC6972838.1 twin-arginine translocase TatA/TatE family subunit [Anaerolineae bacterium]CAG1013476.1 Sec-independent protein translocase protein TatA [Anaerolineae bacterium]
MNLGPTELIIILVIVIVLFGGGRIARLGGELGSAIREFRKGISDGEKKAANKSEPGFSRLSDDDESAASSEQAMANRK